MPGYVVSLSGFIDLVAVPAPRMQRMEEQISVLQPLPSVRLYYMDAVKDNFYLDKMWIQCENSNCLKWRLLSKDDVAQIDLSAPWYCYMNTDPWFNKCSVSEEYFPKASQFQKHGLKYIYSKFPLGSLVLVKLHKWPRWPGILCPDPVNGEYVTYDSDGDVESHHIEFLGNPHSSCWAAIKCIDHYPGSFKPDVFERKKAWYESALEEANKLLACSPQQRLEICYISKNGAVEDNEAKTKNNTVLCNKKVKAWAKTCNKKSNCGKRKSPQEFPWNDTSRTVGRGRRRSIGGQAVCRRKRILSHSLEAASSEDILATENLVVSQTEIILKDLDQVLKHVAAPSKPSFKSFVNGEDNVRGKILKCSTESTEKRPMEINTHENCIIIEGEAFRAGECIENITNRFKEIDSLMAEFQGSFKHL